MYWSRKDPAVNLRMVQEKGGTPVTDYITGVILCCNDPTIDYTGSGSNSKPRGFSGTDISSLVSQYRAHNLTVHVCANLKPVRKTPFWPFSWYKRYFCQDRLGTNVENRWKQERAFRRLR
eukprot:COSAG06_NODE_13392_length_1261_cov_23.743546_3_plen_120_part_00